MGLLIKLLKAVPGFFLNLYQGKVPLVITFWIFFILLGWLPGLVVPRPAFFLFWLLFVSVATWNSASRHKNQAVAIPVQIMAIIAIGLTIIIMILTVPRLILATP